jgi:hypothetical protein
LCDLVAAVPELVSSNAAKIEIRQPRLFRLGAVLIVSAYGALLVLPFIAALLLVSMLQLGILTILIPVLAVVLASIFLPVGLGNPYVLRLVRSMNPPSGKPEDRFIVQLTLSPRARSGIGSVLEDADDIGYLSFDGSGFLFEGDSVKLSVPYECIREVRGQNIGVRGLFVYGRRIGVVVTGLPNVESLEFAERSSWLLPTSRRITRQLYEHLSKR